MARDELVGAQEELGKVRQELSRTQTILEEVWVE